VRPREALAICLIIVCAAWTAIAIHVAQILTDNWTLHVSENRGSVAFSLTHDRSGAPERDPSAVPSPRLEASKPRIAMPTTTNVHRVDPGN
jgi:hypothetical protein